MMLSWLSVPAMAALTGAALASAVLWLSSGRRLTLRVAELEAELERERASAQPAKAEDRAKDEAGNRVENQAEAGVEARLQGPIESKAERTRRQLLADVSHELATPLTAIRGGAETLLDPDVPLSDGEREHLLRDILAAARRMNVLIEDLFDLTRLESRASRLQLERLDWAQLCGHLVERYTSRFEDFGLSVRFAGPDEPAWVMADGRRLEQVLENLLANALRYVTAPGRVRVVLRTLPEKGVHLLRVVDDGPGFGSDDLSRLFDRFYKSDRDRSSPGSGLGLAIVKELIEQHGGRVTAGNRDPRRGSGAVITIELEAAWETESFRPPPS